MYRPEHLLPCGHSICDICVALFGERAKGTEYRFDISTCPLCGKQISFQARTLPPTCGVRFLSIDGGGSRGVIPLAYLIALQEAFSLCYPLQEHFDYGIGTSSGKLE